MARYAAGDDTAFPELYRLLAPRLHAFLGRRLRNPSQAEDVLQQTFLQIHAARSRFSPGSEVMPWAFAIARRLLIDGRIAFELVKLDGMAAPEVAQMLGTTAMGVRLRVHRALQELRDALDLDARGDLAAWT